MTAPAIRLLVPSAFYLSYLVSLFTQSVYYAFFMHYLLWIVAFASTFYAAPADFITTTRWLPLSALFGAGAGFLVAKVLRVNRFIVVDASRPTQANRWPIPWFLISSIGLVVFVYALVTLIEDPLNFAMWLLTVTAFLVFAGSMAMLWAFVVDGEYIVRNKPLVNTDWLSVYYSAALIVAAAVPALLYERVNFANSAAARWTEGLLAAVAALVLLTALLALIALAERSLYAQTQQQSTPRLGVEWFQIAYRVAVIVLTAIAFYVIGGGLTRASITDERLFLWLAVYASALMLASGIIIAVLQLYNNDELKTKRV